MSLVNPSFGRFSYQVLLVCRAELPRIGVRKKSRVRPSGRRGVPKRKPFGANDERPRNLPNAPSKPAKRDGYLAKTFLFHFDARHQLALASSGRVGAVGALWR